MQNLIDKIENVSQKIDEANQNFKTCILNAPLMSKSTKDLDLEKRRRKKKNYDEYDLGDTRKTRNSLSVLAVASESDDNSKSFKDEVDNWETEPKYWGMYGIGKWTQDVVIECNKSKGCLMKCGRNNSIGMIRCDGCGRWCHFKCLQVDIVTNEDFICNICHPEEKATTLINKESEKKDVSCLIEDVINEDIQRNAEPINEK